MTGTVAWISIAPVKGLGLVARESVALTVAGVPEDRRFYLVDEHGRMVNGKRIGPLVTICPRVEDEVLTLTLPDGAVVAAPIVAGERVETTFFGYPRAARLVPGPLSAAISAVVGRSLTLVEPEQPAMDRGRGGAVSLLSATALNGYDARRFRMLLGVEGVPAHAEDGWIGERLRVGEAVIRPRSGTGRCLVTSQDPDTGVADVDMLAVLRGSRPDDLGEPLPFGVHGPVAEPGTVRLGDPVEVLG